MFEGHWALGQVVNTVLLVWSISLFACTIFYGIRNKKFKVLGKRDGDFSGGINYISATIAVFGPIPRLISTQAVIIVGAKYPNGPSCLAVMRGTVACYYFAFYTCYMFLWLRQRSFYGHPVLGKMFNNFVKFISWFAAVVLHVLSLGVLFLYLYPVGYKGSVHGCVRLTSNESLEINQSKFFSSSANAYYVFAIMIFLQSLLFGLFLNPLVRKKEFSVSNSNRRTSSRSNTVYSTIKRTTICTVVTIISDILTLIAVSRFKTPMHVTNAAYDVSLCINAICVVASFAGWKDIFIPKIRKEKIPQTSTPNTSVSNVISVSNAL